MGKWNKIFLVILWSWTLLILSGPLMVPEGQADNLSGAVGSYDNRDVIEQMNPVAKAVYYIGDVNCHQMSHRSYSYNDNQMPFCARDVGIFAGLAIGFTYALGRRIELTLPMILLSLIPIGIDGTVQLLTDYESTNIKRVITGFIAGATTGIALKIIADSLDRN
tara:strand:- start:305 stop:796 length:492 start_codon:yes stop_codon:yes gene_type:complete